MHGISRKKLLEADRVTMEAMRAVAEITNREECAHLLGEALPHVIHGEAENERCTGVLEGLLRKKPRTAEETRLAELLTVLIEERYAPRQAAGPIDVLRHLMDANRLRQVDLVNVFGAPSVVSEALFF